MPRQKSGNFNSTDYKRSFNAQTYDRLNIVVPKGQKAQIEELARLRHQTVNGLVGSLLQREMQLTDEEWKHPPLPETEADSGSAGE